MNNANVIFIWLWNAVCDFCRATDFFSDEVLFFFNFMFTFSELGNCPRLEVPQWQTSLLKKFLNANLPVNPN